MSQKFKKGMTDNEILRAKYATRLLGICPGCKGHVYECDRYVRRGIRYWHFDCLAKKK
ncbi:MAG: hypothetical protein UV02_C0004G0002 [Candidatus Kuenenbacteria bacterium GW2011_GWA2_42_15]|uniref:PARP-type domain-containing protein n=1 Tax=Candidatus Kuenenbacteria bacterium GW2011_GWA2_42_15 TaxID=1618677 RepID=A0A0G1C093_9BACT|nr:MAG: hypothetical protein UV02_C0004G0002 [Candidatus Kuenenbacteria bacterium GW2011_GWA2_42_15]